MHVVGEICDHLGVGGLLLGDFADDTVCRHTGLVGCETHALHFLPHLGWRLEQAGMEIDEDARAGAAEPAGVENVDGPQDAVDIFDVFRCHQREKFTWCYRFTVAVGSHKTFEGIDVQRAA